MTIPLDAYAAALSDGVPMDQKPDMTLLDALRDLVNYDGPSEFGVNYVHPEFGEISIIKLPDEGGIAEIYLDPFPRGPHEHSRHGRGRFQVTLEECKAADKHEHCHYSLKDLK